MLGWDTDKKGNICYFLKNKSIFKADSFETIEFDKDTPGVSLIVGQPNKAPSGVKERHALMFDGSQWTLRSAQKWVDNEGLYYYEEEKKETPKDQEEIKEGSDPKDKEEPTKPLETPQEITEDTPPDNQELTLKETYVELCEGVEVDEANGVIKNVAILRPISRNGYQYTRECMKEAIPLLEGAKSYTDHEMDEKKSLRPRSVKDLVGRVSNIHESEDKRGPFLRGNFHVVGKAGQALMEIAKKMPDLIGMSPHMYGFKKQVNGESQIVKIGRVYSVDVVTTPGTTNSLFESHHVSPQAQGEPQGEKKETHVETKEVKNVETVKVKDISLSFLQENCPELVTEIRQDLLEANSRLEKEVDEFRVQERHRQRETFIQQCLKEANLSGQDCTEIFMKQLREAETDLTVKQLVADRRSMVSRVQGSKPTSVEQPGASLKESENINLSGEVSREDKLSQLSRTLKG